jgi:hypothetical protein
VDIATHIDIFDDGPERRYVIFLTWCNIRTYLPYCAWTLWMNNTLPTCISVSVTDVLCFPCLTRCYHFINGNAGLFNNSYHNVKVIWYPVLFHFSLLVVETADRPGLLVDLVKAISDINITVQSGEFDTEVTLVVWSLCSCKEPFISWHILSFRGYWLKQNSMSVIGAKLWARLCNR